MTRPANQPHALGRTRASRQPLAIGCRDNSHNAAVNIRDVLTERSDPVRNDGTDQPRLVVVGLNFACLPDMGDFAVPMIFTPFHRSSYGD